MAFYDISPTPTTSFPYSAPPPPPFDQSGYYSPPAPPFEVPPSTSGSSSSGGKIIGIGIGAGVTAVVIVVAVIIICIVLRCRKRRKAESASQTPPAPTHDSYEATRSTGSLTGFTGFSSDSASKGGVISSSHYGPQTFTYEQLSIATKHFSDSEMLGRGGSGSVYRGRLPEDGTLVAVKCIAENSNQGVKEFNAEVSIISELRHRNLVKLKGWCHDQGQFVLVYEYMPNGSVDSLLFNDTLCVKLNWERRYAIAMGLGSALLYLHEECDRVIIHRDVKSSNVLLDENFVAKLGDFGLSRQVDLGATSHMTSVVAGTRGYMAPECFFGSGKATWQADVYAFGAVLLEVVCGKRPLDASLREYDGVLVDWVWDLFGQGRVLQAADGRLGGAWDSEEAKRMLVVGLACSHPHPQARPNMRRALDALKGTVALPHVPPSKPSASFGPFPPMSISQVMSPTMGSNATTNSTSTSSSTQYSASSYDSYPFSRPPSHFVR